MASSIEFALVGICCSNRLLGEVSLSRDTLILGIEFNDLTVELPRFSMTGAGTADRTAAPGSDGEVS